MPQDNTQTQPIQPTQDAQGMVQPVENVQPEMNAGAMPGVAPEAVSDVVVTPGVEPVQQEATPTAAVNDVQTEVATRIGESKNVLIALSADPSVDELAAAIGLSLYLDRIGKRATAIYSGVTPNTLEFLKPEETFEPSADTLQDFVIAINKDKADHLRYKLDGDYVKVYITPYKHRISEQDLEFSYGDYNVDLVIALDVANGIDLDSALREHGRIMHDASIINVTTGNPGKFGAIEWSDKSASSVSEMIANLLYQYGGDTGIEKDEATAFLTGIVAATNRFSNTKTEPETMRLASRLMESGANQVLVSKNITPDTENEIFNAKGLAKPVAEGADVNAEAGDGAKAESADEADATKLDVEHGYEKRAKEKATDSDGAETGNVAGNVAEAEEKVEAAEEINADVTKKEHTLLDDLKAAEESLAHTGAETTPVDDGKMMKIENGQMADDGIPAAEPAAEAIMAEPVLPAPVAPEAPAPVTSEALESMSVETPAPVAPEMSAPAAPEIPAPIEAEMPAPVEQSEPETGALEKPEMVIAPSEGFNANMVSDDTNKYGQMLQDALGTDSTPADPSAAIMSSPTPEENIATANTPAVPTAPEINGVPEMNYMPMPDAEILPPPPAPPIEGLPMSEPPVNEPVASEPLVSEQPELVTSAAPAAESVSAAPVEPVNSAEFAIPATEPKPVNQQAAVPENDAGAFRIPGIQ